MRTGEDAQLAAMARFLHAEGLAAMLVRKDWVSFAKRYNGKNYWKNKHDLKLGEQYRRFASGSLPNLEVRTAQAALLYLGYSLGKIDGILGTRTRTALRHFRIAAGLSPGDKRDGEVYTTLCQKAALDP